METSLFLEVRMISFGCLLGGQGGGGLVVYCGFGRVCFSGLGRAVGEDGVGLGGVGEVASFWVWGGAGLGLGFLVGRWGNVRGGLRVCERCPLREEEALLAMELKSALERYISELEREATSPVRSPRNFRSRLSRGREKWGGGGEWL